MSSTFKKCVLFGDAIKCTWTRFQRYLSDRKKFYKEARICHTDGGFEVNLDARKLRTPTGTIVKIPNEGLAHAVATEWNIQKDFVKMNRMPLTALCYAAIDNSSEKTKESFIKSALKYLSTDTLLCHSPDPSELTALQAEKWIPLIDWLHKQYPSVSLKHAVGFDMPVISPQTYNVLTKQLDTYDYWSVVGFETMANVLKSVILSLAIVERHVSVEEAVSLSRLEQEYQISKWGNVEWYHDIELSDLRMKTAACAIFIHLCSEYAHDTIQFREKFKI